MLPPLHAESSCLAIAFPEGMKSVLMKGGRKRGFSLVEVVLALGIVSFAMVAIMGMIPVGLSSLRQSMDETARVHIVQSIVGDLLLSETSGVSSQPRYYDESGGSVDATDANWQYRVKWQVGLSTEVRTGEASVSIPGTRLLVGIETRTRPPRDASDWTVSNAPEEVFIHSAMVNPR